MKKALRNIVVLAFTLVVMFSVTAYASDQQVIDTINVSATTYTGNQKPSISVTTGGVKTTSDLTWSIQPKYWKSGETVTGTLSIEPKSGYIFNTSMTGNLLMTGSNGNLTMSITSNSANSCTISFYYVVTKKLRKPDINYKSGEQYISWDKISGTDYYVLEFFFKDTDEYIETFEVTKPKFDLKKVRKVVDKDDRDRKVYCEIHAVGDSSYVEDSSTSRSGSITLNFTYDDDDDNNCKWPYNNNSSDYHWVSKDSNSWYWTNGSNTKLGWLFVDGGWFYLDPNNTGKMSAGWKKVDGVWYYLNPNHDGTYGKMLTGWQYISGNWYYMYDNGAMAHDCWIGNYYVGSSGSIAYYRN